MALFDVTLCSVSFPFKTVGAGGAAHFLIQTADLTPCPAQCLRPVGLAFGNDNRLYASSDSTGEVGVRAFHLPMVDC